MGFKNKISSKDPSDDDFYENENEKYSNNPYNVLLAAKKISETKYLIGKQEVKISQFSDSIAITCTIDTYGSDIRNNIERYKEEIKEFFILIGYCFWLFIEHVGLIRGSITLGPLYHVGSCIFGPALVEAHYLESKKAKYPRIIISKYLRDKLIQIGLEKELYIKSEDDEIFFIDVFSKVYKTNLHHENKR